MLTGAEGLAVAARRVDPTNGARSEAPARCRNCLRSVCGPMKPSVVEVAEPWLIMSWPYGGVQSIVAATGVGAPPDRIPSSGRIPARSGAPGIDGRLTLGPRGPTILI